MKNVFLVLTLLALSMSCGDNDTSEPFNPDAVDDTTDDVVDDGPTGITPLSDIEMMDLVQRETFKYFWDFANLVSGAARERYIPNDPNNSEEVVTMGGTGFGLMSILVGIERGYVTRAEAVTRLRKITAFLETADRFHGAWPHWLNGNTGNVIPFSPQDDGGDLVETAFLVQGLICVKEYFKDGSTEEQELANKADELWKGVEWDWYTQGEDVLYWHWSPNVGFAIDLQLVGYNETMITYILGAASPDFTTTKAAYDNGWASNGTIASPNVQYGFPLILRHSGSPQLGPTSVL